MAPRPQLITALPVLFDSNQDLDLPATAEVYRWLGEQGLDGALPAGTTGEFVALSTPERLDVCAAAARAVRSGPHVVARRCGEHPPGRGPHP